MFCLRAYGALVQVAAVTLVLGVSSGTLAQARGGARGRGARNQATRAARPGQVNARLGATRARNRGPLRATWVRGVRELPHVRWRTGEGERATIIFLHGLGGRPDGQLMHDVARGLHAENGAFDVLAPWLRSVTMRENGDIVSRQRHTMSDQLRRASELIEAAPGPVILLGHSFGGKAALRLAELYPDKVRGIVALSPSVRMLHSFWKRVTGERGLPADPQVMLDTMSAYETQLRAGLEQAATEKEREAYASELGYVQVMRDLVSYGERQVESSVRTPTLVLHGTEDGAVSIHYARQFAQQNRSVRLVEYDGVGHSFEEDVATGRRGFFGVRREPVTQDIARQIMTFTRELDLSMEREARRQP